jgi:hypothetical protein
MAEGFVPQNWFWNKLEPGSAEGHRPYYIHGQGHAWASHGKKHICVCNLSIIFRA